MISNNILLIGITVIIVIHLLAIGRRVSQYHRVNWSIKSPKYIVDQYLLRDPRVIALPFISPEISIQHNFRTNQSLLYSRLLKYSKPTVFLNIPNNFWIGNKAQLWRTLMSTYDLEKATKITPQSYLLPSQRQALLKDTSNFWVLKTNKHRQTGLQLIKKQLNESQGYQYASRNESQGYQSAKLNESQGYQSAKLNESQGYQSKIFNSKAIVAQRYHADNPLLYQGHKVNLRLYLVINVSRHTSHLWLSPEGIVYYTPEPYMDPEVDFSFDRHITSFYKSSKLFRQGFPNTWSEFLKRIFPELTEESVKHIQNQCYQDCSLIIQKLVAAYSRRLKESKIYQLVSDHICLEFFGVDFHLSHGKRNPSLIIPTLIEVNMGPGLHPYDWRDAKVRRTAIQFYINLILAQARLLKINNSYSSLR